MSEGQLQAQCHLWAWNNYPKLRRMFFAIPNSAKRSFVEGAMMKATGTVAGVADYILVDGITYLFIEFKTTKGKLSESQELFKQAHTYRVVLVRDFESFKQIFKEFYSLP